MSTFPPYISRNQVLERLPIIFPQGTPNRSYCIRELSASTIFSMLYIGAVEGAGIYLGPVHVYRMTHEQAIKKEDSERSFYNTEALKRNFTPTGQRWYADNTREPIRDETLREGLMQVGAVLSLSNVATTSSKPRYALQEAFARLFDPALTGNALTAAIKSWQDLHLSKSALTRIALAAYSTGNVDDQVIVQFPNKETRQLSAGLSSEISKAVIEIFSANFLQAPVVLWLSTSKDKVVARDDKMAASIGLSIQADKDLPDIILVDLGPADPLLVFIEVVATDGAITERRQNAIYALTDAAKFSRAQIAFVTAYHDRASAGFSKTIKGLAWNSYAWFVSEPENIFILKEGTIQLSTLIRM